MIGGRRRQNFCALVCLLVLWWSCPLSCSGGIVTECVPWCHPAAHLKLCCADAAPSPEAERVSVLSLAEATVMSQAGRCICFLTNCFLRPCTATAHQNICASETGWHPSGLQLQYRSILWSHMGFSLCPCNFLRAKVFLNSLVGSAVLQQAGVSFFFFFFFAKK